MDKIDLNELERLFDEDIDMDGEKLEAFGTQVMLSDDYKYAHAFAKNDNFWLAGARARLIAAAINAVPELIARVRELKREVEEWKESSEEYAIQFHALHDEFIENNPNSFTNRFLRGETTKEAGE